MTNYCNLKSDPTDFWLILFIFKIWSRKEALTAQGCDQDGCWLGRLVYRDIDWTLCYVVSEPNDLELKTFFYQHVLNVTVTTLIVQQRTTYLSQRPCGNYYSGICLAFQNKNANIFKWRIIQSFPSRLCCIRNAFFFFFTFFECEGTCYNCRLPLLSFILILSILYLLEQSGVKNILNCRCSVTQVH